MEEDVNARPFKPSANSLAKQLRHQLRPTTEPDPKLELCNTVERMCPGLLHATRSRCEWVFRYGHYIPRAMTNVVYALTLVQETARVVKLQPPIILALIRVDRWATLALVVWNIPGRWFSPRNNESVVNDHRLG